ncbi:MAG: sulfite exporter TauE/SafE family protein [Parcubacteria group bacterium]
MMKHTYYVKGMRCASCEILIERELLSITGVTFANASLSRGSVNIGYEKEKPDVETLNEKFKSHGYTFSEKAFKKENNDLWKIIVGAVLAIAIFLVIVNSGLSSLINLSSASSLSAFFIFGLIAGISSCAALIGGLVLSLSKQWSGRFGKGNSLMEKSKPHFLFNFGRLISFSLLGLLLGFLGEKFKISPVITSVFVVLVSGIMIVLAFQMIGLKSFNRFRIALPKKLSGFLIKNQQFNSMEPFIVGFLTFLLPCGFTIVAEGFAVLSGSSLRGFLIMMLFALGTAIPLLIISFSSTKFLSNEKLSEKFLKIAGILIIFFVAYNLNFQFGITRFIVEKWNLRKDNQTRVLKPDSEIQTIKAVYSRASDIQPSSFEVKVGNKPVRFEIIVKDDSYGCMSTIMIPGLWQKPLSLKKGRTLVMEFTPNKTGTYQITCAMGVPRGTLKVVN